MAKKVWNREMQAKVIAKVWRDENFRKTLINNPKEALKAFGVELPANMTLKVVCDDATHLHFVLPAQPAGVKMLFDPELEKLAGGGDPIQTSPCYCGNDPTL